jgi:N,N'-diacetyllegionaminate synthase
LQAVDLLARIGVAAWKVASGEVSNIPMFESMAQTRLPFLISTGMSSITEVDNAVNWIKAKDLPLTLLQCTTAYPCPPEKVGLNMIPVYRERYGCDVGLSDHSGTIYPGLASVVHGISVLEVHVALSREMFGPDVPASVTTAELKQLVDGVRFIEKMLQSPVDKDLLSREFQPVRELFTKSVVAAIDLAAGTILQAGHLVAKKPGNGIAAGNLPDLVGRRLKRPVTKDQLLGYEDLENVE